MLSRLVVGGGPVCRRILEAVASHPGGATLLARDADVEAAVPVTAGDPEDPSSYPDGTDVVFVADLSPDRTRRVVVTAREALPDATLVVALDTETTEEQRAAIADVADRVVDAANAVAEAVLDVAVGPGGTQARQLYRALRAVGERTPDNDGHLAVVMHDNPDPDAIASAVALARVAGVAGVEATACYYGRVSHQENRAMVNLLDIDIRRLDPGESLEEFAGFALVDHSRPGVNDQLPDGLVVDVVIDHHPPREPVEAGFVDLRSEVGATSTLLTGYLARFGVPAYGGARLATALLYGIRVDTAAFTREATASDFEAAAALTGYADSGLLEQIESPSVTADTMEVVASAIRNREVRGDALASCVGRVTDRDALAQAADRLLDMDGIATTLVYGYDDGALSDGETPTVYASARARGTRLDLGETLRLAFDDLGSAGGHADMAGAQIPLTALGRDVVERDGSDRKRVVEDILTETFFDALADRPREVVRGDTTAYDTDVDPDDSPRGVGDGPRLFSTPPLSAGLPVEWTVEDSVE